MRAVWVCHSSAIGGAELGLLEAVEALRGHGLDSHVLLPRAGELEALLQEKEIPYTILPYRWWVARDQDQGLVRRAARIARNAASFPALVRAVRALSPDVVVTNTLAVPGGALAALALGIPNVWYIHELGREDMGLSFDWGERLSVRMIDRLSARVVGVSHAVVRKFESTIPPERLRLVYNAVQLPERPPVPFPREAGPLRLVTVGMKHPGKRQEDSVRAVALLAAEGVDCHLTLVGREEPEYGAYLRRLVAELGVEDRVDVKRFVGDAFAEIEAAHVFVMSSRNEAFGRVTIEAMKLGRPVIGSDRAGTPEFIRDGWNGLLYRAEDPADLAAKIRVLDRDRSMLQEMAGNALEWATPRFTIDVYVREMYDVLLEAAGRRSDQLPGAAEDLVSEELRRRASGSGYSR